MLVVVRERIRKKKKKNTVNKLRHIHYDSQEVIMQKFYHRSWNYNMKCKEPIAKTNFEL